jgi:hypothetical protein
MHEVDDRRELLRFFLVQTGSVQDVLRLLDGGLAACSGVPEGRTAAWIATSRSPIRRTEDRVQKTMAPP